MEAVNYVRINTATTTTIGGNQGYLVAVNVCTAGAGATITISDNVSGVVVALIDGSARGTYWFGGVRVQGGIKIVTASATPADLTVSYV